jgi:protein-L-isoaspartate(D-aspartate) O-methyltransferase
MPCSSDLGPLRARYAAEICRSAGVKDKGVERAFSIVPRERFLTPAPWQIFSPGGIVDKITDDPADLYQDVLVVLDGRQGINNGQPSLHAAWLAAVAPQPGENAVHVGIGGGYYTAILAGLLGPEGRVDAYEIDPPLAALAERNLSAVVNVAVHAISGAGGELPESDIVYVNAGAFAPDPAWLRALRPRGRLIFPWQPSDKGAGSTLLVTRKRRGFRVDPLMMVGFIPLVDERVRPSSWEADLEATRSVWLTADRPPDRTATACSADVWFSSDEAD